MHWVKKGLTRGFYEIINFDDYQSTPIFKDFVMKKLFIHFMMLLSLSISTTHVIAKDVKNDVSDNAKIVQLAFDDTLKLQNKNLLALSQTELSETKGGAGSSCFLVHGFRLWRTSWWCL